MKTKHAKQIFRKTNIFYLPPPPTLLIRARTCAYQGVRNNRFSFFGVLSFLETPVLRFALLPYYRRVQRIVNIAHLGTSEFENYFTQLNSKQWLNWIKHAPLSYDGDNLVGLEESELLKIKKHCDPQVCCISKIHKVNNYFLLLPGVHFRMMLRTFKNTAIEKKTDGPNMTLNSTFKGAPKLHLLPYPLVIIILLKRVYMSLSPLLSILLKN